MTPCQRRALLRPSLGYKREGGSALMNASLLICLSAFMLLSLAALQAQQTPINLGSAKQVFVDGLLIDSSEGVTLTMNPPVKTGERNLVAEKPWESHRLCAYNSVFEDQGIFKMYYDAIDSQGGRWLCYATSADGIHWDKPALGIVEYQGSKDNNIVFPVEKKDHEPGCVFIDANPNCPPDQRYKMVCSYAGPGGFGTYVFFSADGLHWLPLSDKPSFRGSDTGNVAFWDDRLGRYLAYIRMWNPWRTVGRCETDDLRDFGPEQQVFACDEQDPPDLDLYTNAAIKYPYAENAYFIFPSAYHHYPEPPASKYSNDGPLDIRLAVSHDGVLFAYVDRRPFVPLGLAGTFDDSTAYMTTGLLRAGNELFMYYEGADFTHGAYSTENDKFKSVISRLVLRLDGFVSADAAYGGGSLTTVPITFTGSRLELNVQTSVAGTARVEILDAGGKPIPGFTLADADVIRGNYIAKVVTWKGNADLSSLGGKPLRLHLSLRDAKLYGFQFPE